MSSDEPREQVAREIERLRRLVSGGAGDRAEGIAVPEYGRPYAQGSLVPLLGNQAIQLSSGLIVPSHAGQPTQPIDLVKVYLTFEDVFLVKPSESDIEQALASHTLMQILFACSAVLLHIQAPDAKLKQTSLELTEGLQPAAALRAKNLIASGRVLVVPQAALVLLKRAFKECPQSEWDGSTINVVPLLLAIQSLLSNERHESPPQTLVGMHPDTDGNLLAEILRNQNFNSTPDETLQMASFQRRWRELPNQLRNHPEYVDLEESYRQATGTSLDDLITVAMGMWAAVFSSKSPLVDLSWFSTLGWDAERLSAALAPVAANLDDLSHMLDEQDIRLGDDWAFDTIRRFPVIQVDPARLLVLSPDLLIERVFGWTLRFDLTAFGPVKTREQEHAVNFLRQVSEAEIHECLGQIAPAVSGEKRTWNGDEIRQAFGSAPKLKLADAAIDYGDAWVVLEISTRQLRREVVIGGNLETLEDDLRKGIVKKAVQLAQTIEALKSDEGRLTGRAPTKRRLYVPVLVVTEGFPLNPVVSTAIDTLLAEHELLQGPGIAPLRVLGREDLFAVEAGAAYGTSFLQYLEEYERGALRQMPFSTWLSKERRESRPIPSRLTDLMGRAFDPTLAQLRAADLQHADSPPDEHTG